MRISVRRMGNSAGIILPKQGLAELGVKAGDDLSLTLEGGRAVLKLAEAHACAGWADAAEQLAAAGDDALVWPEFGNAEDDKLVW